MVVADGPVAWRSSGLWWGPAGLGGAPMPAGPYAAGATR
jgi:hypothetical protein